MSLFQLTASIPMIADRERADAPPAVDPGQEALLFGRFLGGDDIAAIKVFKKYNNRLFVYCMKVLGDRDQAKDLTQEIWERVVRLRANPPEVHNPMGFLLKIARNLCLNHLRLKKELLPLGAVPESAHPSHAPESFTDLEEMVLASLDELSFDHREVLILNIYCGYRFDEIAAMMGKSPDAIWARASRARAQLRKAVRAMIDGKPGSQRNDNHANAGAES